MANESSTSVQFYAQGVKANVLFFDRKPASESPGLNSCGSKTCAPRTSPSRPGSSFARIWMSLWPATTQPIATTASPFGLKRIRRAVGVHSAMKN
jgi:hypothetical protein